MRNSGKDNVKRTAIRILLVVAFFCMPVIVAVAQPEAISLSVNQRVGSDTYASVLTNKYAIIRFAPRMNDTDCRIIDLDSLASRSLGLVHFTRILGPWENKIITLQEGNLPNVVYDLKTSESEAYPFVDRFIKENQDLTYWPMRSFFYYQNDEGFLQMNELKPLDSGPSAISRLTLATETNRRLPIHGIIHAISPDKEYVLIDTDERPSRPDDYKLEDRDFILYRIEDEKEEIGYGHPNPEDGDSGDEDFGGQFVGNEHIMVPCGSYPDGNYWMQPIGHPEQAKKLNITVQGKPRTIQFSPNFKWGLCDIDNKAYLVDATPLRNWLMSHNLLFKETTAKVTDTHIRVRENPNLQAKHMGFLEQGEIVKVLDRSGPKETIDPWGEHPWYRIVRESDGLSGWCFGAFLNLAEEQGELRYKGDGMVTVYEE